MSAYITVQHFVTFCPYFPSRLVFSCSIIIILLEKNISNFVSFPHYLKYIGNYHTNFYSHRTKNTGVILDINSRKIKRFYVKFKYPEILLPPGAMDCV